jgi:hypothetical protein
MVESKVEAQHGPMTALPDDMSNDVTQPSAPVDSPAELTAAYHLTCWYLSPINLCINSYMALNDATTMFRVLIRHLGQVIDAA